MNSSFENNYYDKYLKYKKKYFELKNIIQYKSKYSMSIVDSSPSPLPSPIIKEQVTSPSLKKEQVISPSLKKEQVTSPSLKKEQVISPSLKKEQVISPSLKKEQVISPSLKKEQVTNPKIEKRPEIDPFFDKASFNKKYTLIIINSQNEFDILLNKEVNKPWEELAKILKNSPYNFKKLGYNSDIEENILDINNDNFSNFFKDDKTITLFALL